MIKEAQIVEAIEMMPGDQVMASELDMPMDEVIVEEIPVVIDDKVRKFDPKDVNTFDLFLDHMNEQIEKIPPHSGQTALGCHRAIQYLKRKIKELSDTFGSDFEGKIDEKKAEDLLRKINKMIKGLEQRYAKINEAYNNDGVYASNQSSGLTKLSEENLDAQSLGSEVVASCDSCGFEMIKTSEDEYGCVSCEKKVKAKLTKNAGTASFTLVVSPFERAIAGMIINGSVSNGKNPEAIYSHVKEKYKLTPREEISIRQVLADMGYPMLFDRGLVGEKDENPLNKGVELAGNSFA